MSKEKEGPSFKSRLMISHTRAPRAPRAPTSSPTPVRGGMVTLGRTSDGRLSFTRQAHVWSAPSSMAVASAVASESTSLEVSSAPCSLAGPSTCYSLAVPSASSVLPRVLQPTPMCRLACGSSGDSCKIRTNYYKIGFNECANIHLYKVSIKTEPDIKEWGGIMNRLITYFQNTPGYSTALYDGRCSLVCAGPMPFKNRLFKVNHWTFDKTVVHEVEIEFVCIATQGGKLDDGDFDAIPNLNLIFRHTPLDRDIVLGRSLLNKDEKVNLNDIIEMWPGFHQSLKQTQIGPCVNIDRVNGLFYRPIGVYDFARFFLPSDEIWQSPLSEINKAKVEMELKDMVVVSQSGQKNKNYTVKNVLSPHLDEGITVQQQYYKNLCLFAENKADAKLSGYFPMEEFKIKERQRFCRKLSSQAQRKLVSLTQSEPDRRLQGITQFMQQMKLKYADHPLITKFGIEVTDEPIKVDARILPTPKLMYLDNKGHTSFKPSAGKWSMDQKKVVNGGKVETWKCLNFSNLSESLVTSFCQELFITCSSIGLDITRYSVPRIVKGDPSDIGRSLREVHLQSTVKGGVPATQLKLLIVILPDIFGTSYKTIKRICDTELGIISQCLQPATLKICNIRILESLALKINAKVGGQNTALVHTILSESPGGVSDCTIIFGADVTHSTDDLGCSISAVVGSLDWPRVGRYKALVTAQDPNQEIIRLEGMISELLDAFFKSTNKMPSRIIFYRDGVSNTQFSQVLRDEVGDIKKACQSYFKTDQPQPKLTYVVVQKRHHTRFIPEVKEMNCNAFPGTIVDNTICHPALNDFYLLSHPGEKGRTSRPSHFTVLIDENHFAVDEFQEFTNSLCYTYVKCTKAISNVPPINYAHMAAARARNYIETSRPSSSKVQPLPEIKPNVGDYMFFC